MERAVLNWSLPAAARAPAFHEHAVAVNLATRALAGAVGDKDVALGVEGHIGGPSNRSALHARRRRCAGRRAAGIAAGRELRTASGLRPSIIRMRNWGSNLITMPL